MQKKTFKHRLKIGDKVLRRDSNGGEPDKWVECFVNETYLKLIDEFPEDYKQIDGLPMLKQLIIEVLKNNKIYLDDHRGVDIYGIEEDQFENVAQEVVDNLPEETTFGSVSEEQTRPEDNYHINYGTLVNPEELYPVIYVRRQDGTKEFEPRYLNGKHLTQPQIKYLYSLGYFDKA